MAKRVRVSFDASIRNSSVDVIPWNMGRSRSMPVSIMAMVHPSPGRTSSPSARARFAHAWLALIAASPHWFEKLGSVRKSSASAPPPATRTPRRRCRPLLVGVDAQSARLRSSPADYAVLSCGRARWTRCAPRAPPVRVAGDNEPVSGATQKRSSVRTPAMTRDVPKPSRAAITPAP